MNNTTVVPSDAVHGPSSASFAVWNFRAVVRLVADIVALLLNGLIIYFIYKDRAKTSFKMYIANLCAVDFFYALSYVGDLINIWYVFPAAVPRSWCMFFRYMETITAGLVTNAHFLIGLNRVWAVAWPISYRQYNRNNAIRNPLIICVGMWVYVHVLDIPGTVMSEMAQRSKPPEMYRCIPHLPIPLWWAVPIHIIKMDIPVTFCCLIYPIILYKTVHRASEKRSNKVGQAKPTVPATSNQNGSGAPTEMAELTNKDENRTADVTKVEAGEAKTQPRFSFLGWIREALDGVRHGQFLTLSCLTLNVAVCLWPAQLFFLLLYFDINLPGMYPVITMLFSLSLTIDPILLLLTMKSLRDSFKALVKGKCEH